jgi:hypothetical protein
MEFQRFADFPNAILEGERYERYIEEIEAHWWSLGWQIVPKADEPAIKWAWISNLEPGGELIVPKPSWSWSGQALARHLQQPDLESEFTLKLLDAFRRCTRPGERLWVIDWLHSWYYFDPHGGITVATRDEWAKPVLPDGDAYNYVAPDFRFGVIMGWRVTGPVTLFGADLVAALAANPPEGFLQACGPGKQTHTDTSDRVHGARDSGS